MAIIETMCRNNCSIKNKTTDKSVILYNIYVFLNVFKQKKLILDC